MDRVPAGGMGRKTSIWPRSTTCPPNSNSTGTAHRTLRAGRGEGLLRTGDHDRRTSARQPDGGLACFGEGDPAQAISQWCELVWRSGAGEGRQVRRESRHHRQQACSPRQFVIVAL